MRSHGALGRLRSCFKRPLAALQREIERDLLSVAVDADLDLIAGLVLDEVGAEILPSADLLTIPADEDIALFDASLRCRAILGNARDHHARTI